MKTPPTNKFDDARQLVRNYEDIVASCYAIAKHGEKKSTLLALIDEAETNARLRAWRPVERFPETIDGVESWGYHRPQTKEEFDAEQPINFPGYPTLGEVHEETMPFGHIMLVASSEIVETRSRNGAIVSARWVWHARAGLPYRWEIAPQKWPIEPRNVDFWRPMDSI